MKQDERTNLTKHKLSEVLKNKMKKKPVSKITVSELIKECDINRNTFYYHFESVYDLLKWTFEQEAIEVVKNFDLLVDYKEAIMFVMDYVENNEHMLKCVYDSMGKEELKRFFLKDFQDIVYIIIDGAAKEFEKDLDKDYREFLCLFYTEALAGLLTEWLCKGRIKDKNKNSEYLVKTIKLSMMGVISGLK